MTNSYLAPDLTQLPGYDPATDIYTAPPPPPGPTTTGAAPRDLIPLEPYKEPPRKATPRDLIPLEPYAPETPPPQIGTGTGIATAFEHGLTSGFGPWLEGAIEGGLPYIQQQLQRARGISPLTSADILAGETQTKEEKAAEKARKAAEQRYEEAYKQLPWYATYPVEAVGALAQTAIPGLRAVTGAARLGEEGLLAARLARGGFQGAKGGATYGVGSGLSEGRINSLYDAFQEAATGAALGGATGATLHGALGPRPPPSPTTAGGAAALTAERLGAPLPRGVVSDRPWVQSTTARLRQTPLIGSRIGEQVGETQRAAGHEILNIASGGTGIEPNRTLAGTMLRPALRDVMERNRGHIQAAYTNLRGMINPTRPGPTPQTRGLLARVLRERREARLEPWQGLANIRRLTDRGPISFNGLQRARQDLGEAIDWEEAHGGYRVQDLRDLYRAMSGDLERLVRQHARGNPNSAAAAFQQAEQTAAEHIQRNQRISRMIGPVTSNERLTGALIRAAQGKTGDRALLAQLRASMPPGDFEHIAGTMLYELGQNKNGEFSLRQFVTQWGKVQNAARVMFSPQHLDNINEIVGMGRHIDRALAESSTSHSANLLVFLEVAGLISGAAVDIAHGGFGWGSIADLAQGGSIFGLTHFLSNPAVASSAANWSRARRALGTGWSAARQAAFIAATRNLAHTLNIPVERFLSIDPLFRSREKLGNAA